MSETEQDNKSTENQEQEQEQEQEKEKEQEQEQEQEKEKEKEQVQKQALPNPDIIDVKVVSQDGNTVCFKIKKQTPLKRMIDAYCNRQAIDLNSVRFLFDGKRIQEQNTPKELEMENSDVIDVVLQQTGGFLL